MQLKSKRGEQLNSRRSAGIRPSFRSERQSLRRGDEQAAGEDRSRTVRLVYQRSISNTQTVAWTST